MLEQVLALPEGEREDFVTELLARLPDRGGGALSDEWIGEIERRLDQIDSGEVVCETWDVVEQRLFAKLPKE